MVEKSLYQGNSLRCSQEHGLIEICFDNQKASVNKFDSATLQELREAIDRIKKEKGVQGLLFTSGKDVFFVGADITEFLAFFKSPELNVWLEKTHALFNDIEDLPFPTVAALNGMALGGGFELALSCAYRLASPSARLGLPETKLGIIPGWGGTIRLPRLTGIDNAVEWIASGKNWKPEDALKIGAIDGIVSAERLGVAARDLLRSAWASKLPWQARQQEKKEALKLLSPIEKVMAIETSKAFVASQAGKHYPAPVEAINIIDKSAHLKREEAQKVERTSFAMLAKTSCAESLVTIFLSDQYNKKKVKQLAKQSKPIKQTAVLGAGIMGGGIAYQSACSGVPILMKDVVPQALEYGMQEAAKLLGNDVAKGRRDQAFLARVLSSITPTLSYGDFRNVDLVVEAIIENEDIKKSVLSELAKQTKEGTIITSNTSTISIDQLAKVLPHPENFCGMHFFNPVHRMPLVEIIRGKKSSDETIASVVAYALTMGKTPIVVKDCPGFLVNRVLFPYFWGFLNVVLEGVHPYHIDKVMEKFGWPMGPAYLLDVIGIDTSHHAQTIIAKGFPDRMPLENPSLLGLFNKEKRLGQKNKLGFYRYETDKKGRLQKTPDPQTDKLLSSVVRGKKDMSDEDIIDRLMLPLINECARCLDEGIVESVQELDLALINGIGFPPFLGGALKFLDYYGMERFYKKTLQLGSFGKAYEAPALIQKQGQSGKSFYN
ncbi:MAG: fatty acid oxidation complex subunit alpha FadB [Deltaproteobacteria bacterium]|nr:fatty acid oxidation complex subunit alpha FadB [Deltaproteobacteria bacterium]